MLGNALGRKGLAAVATIASRETILHWYRDPVAKKYDGSQRRGQGRPKTAADIAALIVKMARRMASLRCQSGKSECRGRHSNELIVPAKAANGAGKVSRRGRLGGLLSFYCCETA